MNLEEFGKKCIEILSIEFKTNIFSVLIILIIGFLLGVILL